MIYYYYLSSSLTLQVQVPESSTARSKMVTAQFERVVPATAGLGFVGSEGRCAENKRVSCVLQVQELGGSCFLG